MRIFLFSILLLLTISVYSSEELVMSFFSNTEYKKVAHIISAQAILETSWFKSESHNTRNNLFSIKDFSDSRCPDIPIACLATYSTRKESLKGMLGYLRRKGYSTYPDGYYNDLQNYNYAEDKFYVDKLKSIVRRIRNRRNKLIKGEKK